jgi:hypothetical protein
MSLDNAKIGCKILILKQSKILIIKEVKGLYMQPNQRLIPIQKWHNQRDIQLIDFPRY